MPLIGNSVGSLRELASLLLAGMPRLYEAALRCKGRVNFEKVVFLHLVRRGDVVFDVGANRGNYTLLFSHLVGKTGRVHAFEPVPRTYQRLSATCSRGRNSNLVLNNNAASDANQSVMMYMPDEDDGQASMKEQESGTWSNADAVTAFACEALRLDDYAVARGVGRLDFVKMDIEGAELLALRGFASQLREHRPIIHLEISSDWTRPFGYAPADLISFVKSLGYSRFYVITDGVEALEEYSPSENFSDARSGSWNMLCVAEGNEHRMNRLLSRYGRNTTSPSR